MQLSISNRFLAGSGGEAGAGAAGLSAARRAFDDRAPGDGIAAGHPARPQSPERETFIRLPWRLYQGQANWVPPLLSERKRHLDRSRNPFFEHAEAEYFLAWRTGKPVGRITAHVDHRLNEFQDNRWGLFGFFESERDPG